MIGPSPAARLEGTFRLFDAGLIEPDGFAKLLGIECTDALRLALYRRAAIIAERQEQEELAADAQVSW